MSQVRRRRFLFAAGALLAAVASMARAQQQLVRVGVLAPSTREKETVILRSFFERMRELGWIEGKNLVYEHAYADDQQDRLPELAVKLVASRPALIFAPPTPAAVAASKATRTIPIVFGTVPDPVALGLVKSLARPGGNITGITQDAGPLVNKRVEFLREILPKAKRIGVLFDPSDPGSTHEKLLVEKTAPLLGFDIVALPASHPQEIRPVLEASGKRKLDAYLVVTSPLFYNQRHSILDVTSRLRVPASLPRRESVADGALFAYSTSFSLQFRVAAEIADRILKGADPADTPVQQPTTFALTINLKTARTLGITIPQSLLVRADELIQ